MKFNRKNISVVLLMLTVMLVASCTAIDHHYRDYLENAEKIYPGRADSISFKPGHNRAAIRALISTDSRVVKMRISWGADKSFEANISSEDIANYKEVIIPNIDEGIYTFEIRTFDAQGSQSMRSEIFGRVYGANYSANLNNRILNNVSRDANNQIVLNWFAESADSTLLGTVVSYLTVAGDSAQVFTNANINETPIPNFKEGSTLKYRTQYRPSSLAIDTFFATEVELDPLDYIEVRTLYPRTTWSIAGFSSEEPNNNRSAISLIDNNDATFWIARFSNNATDYPNHWVTIDMKEMLKVNGFMFAQKNGDRKIRELEVQVSDDNVTWRTAGLFGPVAVDRVYQYFDLADPISFRYFKIIPKAGHDNQKQPGLAEAGTFFLDR
ncbi:DUF4998 domain-containing protein [Sphingobacterium hungaricum]|uniref:F5/8 type C domain-containing protein n=1 Tax=Sphingobacterium hungaricum TaxID=2082723 RepID=A0A928UWN3_9SPHI|nr:DUF4998 domain-containing protein [Sphingobacterium hungaricum]MBE8714067.1 hypothetical protein [Sphingobacterium hungaricum]